MHRISLTTAIGLGMLVSACTNKDDPQLAMCQAVAKQLTDYAIAAWSRGN